MRYFIVILALVGAFVMVGTGAAEALAVPGANQVIALAQPPGQVDITVDVDDGGSAWWTNPIWIVIGIIGLVLIVLIIAIAARGSGVTVIKE